MNITPLEKGPIGQIIWRALAMLNVAIIQVTSLPRHHKKLVVGAIDGILLVCSIWFAYSLRTGEWSLLSPSITKMLWPTTLLAIPIFVFSGVYRTVFRYAGVGMLQILIRAFLLYTVVVVVIYTIIGIEGVPRTMGLLQPIIYFGFMAASRIFFRYLVFDVVSKIGPRESARITLIYGAGQAGQQILQSLSDDPAMRFAGYIDDDANIAGQRINGAKVWHSLDLLTVIERFGVTDILLAMPDASRRRRRAIVDELHDHPVIVRILPSTQDIIEGKVSVSDIQPLQVEDLLGREPIAPDMTLLDRTIVGKVVMVTGAGGSIGSELARQILRIGARKLILYEVSEFALYQIERELRTSLEAAKCEIVPLLGCVRNRVRLKDLFGELHIDTVFHAAAYRHVPLVEANPLEGIRNNIIGTAEMVRASHDAKVQDFILISTDKAVRPTNVMGATKRGAEQVLQAFAEMSDTTRFSMVRFGNVLGSSGSVVPLFSRQIQNGGPITVTHRDVTRYFMTIAEAANLVIQAGGMATGGEVYVLDMGRPVKIIDLADKMIRLSGLTVRDELRPDGDIEIKEVGLRPGEKLYEELLIGNEPIATRHKRILMAQESFMAWDELARIIGLLRECRDRQEAILLLEELVPDFEHRRDNLPAADVSQQQRAVGA
ncbi:Capsular polysaccharide biosynthesis protein CapD [Alteripontixanthobacter maritimus]|uniref:Capsular polysaccharide biosynthesis protein CapD n=1 Tax=Alteripontixanthobacter maritimus TaxID=2161824 RepID=A0A369QAM0_9SPHN|nr:nucleoside-diphosphate sugar epimerase/dehydratase [Alteripontixanthobacter maritimus]RDC61380.1 Capsular polysaccharide biosynthesis protein CapD [Alteripontixanthobacter maritimus]